MTPEAQLGAMGAESGRICCSTPEKGEEELVTAEGHRVDGLRFSLCAQTTELLNGVL